MDRQQVIIIGAGASGLMAAAEISAICDVTILETNSRTGGRIRTLPVKSGGGVIESGAEFVHGDTPITKRLIQEAGLKTVKLNGKMMRKEGEKWTEEKDMIEGWDQLVEKMKGQRKDMTMDDFTQKYFAGDKFADLRRYIKSFVQGFDVADTSEVSVQSLYREWSNEGDQCRITTGYGSLVEYLENKCRENGCKIFTGETVKQIDWQKNDVTVYTAAGKKYNGNKVIITVPVSVLRDLTGKAAVNLTPPADEYIHAVRRIGFGTVIRVTLDLKEKIWQEKTGFIFSNEMIPTWWTQYPVDNNLLSGWAGGPAASGLSQHSDDELLEIATASLANIFDITRSELSNIIRRSYVFNWSKYDESLGAYSFSTPASVSARQILNTPIEGTVFFAGEGLYDGPFSGTVEAALNSGTKTAARLLKTIP